MNEREINSEQFSPNQIVKVDQGSGISVEVNLVDVDKVFKGISDYNYQFSSGAIMAHWISGNFRGESIDSLVASENDSRGWSEMSLSLASAGVLDKIGLSFDSVSGKKSMIMFQDRTVGGGEMRLNLVNGGKFNSFLSALSVEQVDNFNLKDNLSEMSVILTDQLLDSYDLSKPTDAALELLVNLDKVVFQYKRLGLERAVSKLEIYADHAKRRDLREFLVVDRKGLFTEPGEGFGPGDWQKDASPEFLWERWSEALDTLKMLKESPRGKGIYTELLGHLRKCLSAAMESMLPLNYYSDERKLELMEVLEKVNARFELEV